VSKKTVDKDEQSVRCRICKSAGWSCNKCCVMLPALWHVDHIKPLVDGGSEEPKSTEALSAHVTHRVKTSSGTGGTLKNRRVAKLNEFGDSM
jgi:hypothetical protein